ncbi:MAG: hypothetical protein WCF85_11945 [Rhodospirillaceae bacterium]
MKRIALTCALLSGIAFALPALADSRDFELVNGTGYPIKHVYIDEASSDSWSEDILGRDVLDNGESVKIEFGKADKGCKWDMKVVYTDASSAVWSNLNLCTIDSLTLKYNHDTGVTSAVSK